MSDGSPLMRDVRNHVLFEVATEVANRGISLHNNVAILLLANQNLFDNHSGWDIFCA